ncbi:MAG: IS1380 family transposase [Gemmatimonadota bacterium]
MSQGLLPYTVEVVERADTVTGRAGLPLVVETMRALGLDDAIAQHVHVRERQSGYSETAKIEALVLLLAAGGECFDDIRVLQADAGLTRLLDRTLPSADTLRHFVYAFHDDRLILEAQAARPPDRVAYIPAENAALQGLAHVNTALVHRVAAEGQCHTATLDHDATIQESHKREARPHYQDGRGYQPTAIYWVEQDLVLADEYRDGNVPAGMETLPLIQRGFASLPASVTRFFFRADSACYDERSLKWLADPQRPGGPQGPIGFTVSADMTAPLHAVCAAVREPAWALFEDRPDETVHCAEVEFFPGDWPKLAQPLRYVALRIRKKQGQLFANGTDTKYLAIVSSRWDVPASELLRWHWQKAGTIELVHAITKNELGAAVPPCGRFGANAAWYRLSLLTYNVLSALKSLALPASLSAARPKRLRFTVFTLAGRLAAHAGRLWLRVGAEAERLAGLIAARGQLLRLAHAPPAG